MTHWLGHGAWVVALTLLTQLGGIAWLLALPLRRRWLWFVVIYTALTVASLFIAPLFGRVPLPCFGETLSIQSPLYCALNRQYVTPATRDVAQTLANRMAVAHPGTQTRALDGNFPYFDGFPLLPHLSHDDGEKLDFALYWQDAGGNYRPGASKLPIGYWGYAPGLTACPTTARDLRWDMGWLQGIRAGWQVDVPRLRSALRILAEETPTAKILIEPHLSDVAGVTSPKIRFQGCRAARHDDHIHIQL